jgi:hypothetical protein
MASIPAKRYANTVGINPRVLDGMLEREYARGFRNGMIHCIRIIAGQAFTACADLTPEQFDAMQTRCVAALEAAFTERKARGRE